VEHHQAAGPDRAAGRRDATTLRLLTAADLALGCGPQARSPRCGPVRLARSQRRRLNRLGRSACAELGHLSGPELVVATVASSACDEDPCRIRNVEALLGSWMKPSHASADRASAKSLHCSTGCPACQLR
jgi:hypothetical protein